MTKLLGVSMVALIAGVASAQTVPAPDQAAVQADAPDVSNAHPRDVIITARRLNEARAAVQPSLGATSYGVTNTTIQALPGGDNQQFNQIVLQLPGVVQDGFGQFHVRDDHNGLQYRINGTILPEGIAVFGQTLSPRLIDHLLRQGGLPPRQAWHRKRRRLLDPAARSHQPGHRVRLCRPYPRRG